MSQLTFDMIGVTIQIFSFIPVNYNAVYAIYCME